MTRLSSVIVAPTVEDISNCNELFLVNSFLLFGMIKPLNLLVLNKVADDLTEFFKSFSKSEEFENMSLDKFTNYRRVPENELKKQNPQVVKVIETTNDILDDVLLHSLQQDQAILNIAKNNGISDSVIVDAIYHMIGSHNPLNANQVQAALYQVAN